MLAIKFLVKIQPLIVLTLMVTFFVYFGWPAYQKFAKKEVFIKEYTRKSAPLEAPAVTICVNPVSGNCDPE